MASAALRLLAQAAAPLPAGPHDLAQAALPLWAEFSAAARVRLLLIGDAADGAGLPARLFTWPEPSAPPPAKSAAAASSVSAASAATAASMAPAAPLAPAPAPVPVPGAADAQALPWSWPLLCEVLGPALAAGEPVRVDASRPHAMSVLRWGQVQAPQVCVVQALLHGGEPQGLLMLADPSADAPALLRGPWQPLLQACTTALAALRLREQRDLARRSAHEVEAGYRAIFDTAAAGIARLSPGARLEDANPRFCEIVGRELAEVQGRSILDLTHPDDIATDLALLDAALAGKTPESRYGREKRYVRPDGSIVWVAVSGVVVRDAAGRPSHLISVIEDITERKRYHDALSAVQSAERANRAKSEFLSRMSHELRTPLNAMLGFAQLLRVDASQPLSVTQRTKVEHIERAGAHLLAMINDVLDLSRIEAGGLSMSLETLRVGSVVDESIELVAGAARRAEVQIRWEPPAVPLHARADRVRLRQVLVNLLSNAVKYNYTGGSVHITLAAGVGPGGRQVQVSVADTGPGLTAEQQAHLFEPFNRLGAERSGVEGTGIGLVVVRRLVELMQGGIALESRSGQGTTVSIWLPQAEAPALAGPGRVGWQALGTAGPATVPGALAEPDDDEPFLTSPLPLDEAQAGPSDQPFTVLYAEDNDVNVELVRQVMRMRPAYRLLVAHSGAQAIELARSQRPSVMLMDMHLGDMSGLDVVAVLEREPATAGIPRIALSADALPDQIRAARERGFRIYLTKPLDVASLLRALDDQAQQTAQGQMA